MTKSRSDGAAGEGWRVCWKDAVHPGHQNPPEQVWMAGIPRAEAMSEVIACADATHAGQVWIERV